jgi:hypothetical protein
MRDRLPFTKLKTFIWRSTNLESDMKKRRQKSQSKKSSSEKDGTIAFVE